MKIKLWILYKNGISYSKIVAEMLQDRLDDYIDVSVGNAKKIEPEYLIEEELDYLILGDMISKEIPSLEIQNWLLKYKEISSNKNIILKALSGYNIILPGVKTERFVIEALQENINAEMIFPPIICIRVNLEELTLENGAIELIKEYTNDFVELL